MAALHKIETTRQLTERAGCDRAALHAGKPANDKQRSQREVTRWRVEGCHGQKTVGGFRKQRSGELRKFEIHINRNKRGVLSVSKHGKPF